jgi:hypothetical protein
MNRNAVLQCLIFVTKAQITLFLKFNFKPRVTSVQKRCPTATKTMRLDMNSWYLCRCCCHSITCVVNLFLPCLLVSLSFHLIYLKLVVYLVEISIFEFLFEKYAIGLFPYLFKLNMFFKR